MTSKTQKWMTDNAGVAAVEFALIAPILFMLILGIWNTGTMLFAYNGVQNAVESGARHATIFPRPTEQQIETIMMDRYYGPNNGDLGSPVFAYTVQNNSPAVTITMAYTHDASLPFLDLSPVVIQHQRTVYLAPAGTP